MTSQPPPHTPVHGRRACAALCLIAATLAVSTACAEENYRPAPAPSAILFETPVRGTVRDSSGVPIQGVTVTAAVQDLTHLRPSTVTGHDGGFSLRVSAPRSPVQLSLFTSAEGYTAPAWATTYVPGVDITAEIRMQRHLSLSVGESLSSVLLTDDLVWMLDDRRSCSPCQMVTFGPPNVAPQPRVVSVTWKGNAVPRLLLFGYDSAYDILEIFGTLVENQRLEATIPAMFSARAYVGIAGDSVVEPIAYDMSLQWGTTEGQL